MIREQIAAKYSQALFELGKENDNLLPLYEDLKKFWETVNENQELKQVIFHHRILPREKKRVLERIFADSLNIYILNFIKLLIDKRREYFLELIVEDYEERILNEKKILNMKVITAVELKDNQKEQLQEKLNKLLDYEVRLEEEVNPSIMGGLILKTKHHIIDGSIINKLENLSENIEKIPVSELGV